MMKLFNRDHKISPTRLTNMLIVLFKTLNSHQPNSLGGKQDMEGFLIDAVLKDLHRDIFSPDENKILERFRKVLSEIAQYESNDLAKIANAMTSIIERNRTLLEQVLLLVGSVYLTTMQYQQYTPEDYNNTTTH